MDDEYRSVTVTWQDAHASDRWTRFEDCDREPRYIVSNGLLIPDEKNGHAFIVQSLDFEGGLVDGMLAIPMAQVYEIEEGRLVNFPKLIKKASR